MRIKLLLSIFFLQFCLLSHSQNIVMYVNGKVLVNGQQVKKGDNIANNVKPVFGSPDAVLKVISQTGNICTIGYRNYAQKSSSELLDLIKSCIRKVNVETFATRSLNINQDKDRQVALVDSLCKTLNVTSDNVEVIFSQYITPYCVSEFITPYWQDIALFLKTKYGYNPSRATGELMTREQYQKIPLVSKTRSIYPLPSAASLKKYCPIPGNQGQYGTCTGWASAYGCRTISWAIKNDLTDINDITNQAFSPAFVYAQIKNPNDYLCKDGSTIDASVEILKNRGDIFFSDLPDIPYQCTPNIAPFLSQAKAYAIKDYQRLTSNSGITSQTDLDNIKQALADKKPVLACIRCYQSFGGAIWNGELDDHPGGHAICIIGYDDNFDNGDGTIGAVEMMNSWSTLWGDGGFIHVKYKDLPKILYYAISMYDDALPVPPPEPPKPEPAPVPPTPVDTMKRMEGSFELILKDNGVAMQVEGDQAVFRNIILASDEKMTYNIAGSYSTGTQFHINLTSSQPAYVYVIASDSKHSPIEQLFPNPSGNNSALIDFSSKVSVTIPDPDDNLAMTLDELQVEDYLCVIFSKDALDMNTIINSFQANPTKGFVNCVKNALSGKVVDANEVTFEKNQIAFKSASANHTVVPIFIKIKHS